MQLIKELLSLVEASQQPIGSAGANYAEQLAHQIFGLNPNMDTAGNAGKLLKHAYSVAEKELGADRAKGFFRDGDFLGDFVTTYHALQKQGVTEGRDELQSELKTINQQLKDAFKEYKKNHQMHPNQYMKKVKELKDRSDELIKQLQQGITEDSVYATDSKMLAGRPDLPVTIHKSPNEGSEVGEYIQTFHASPKTAQQFAKYIILKGGSARIGKRGQDLYVYHKGAGPITKRDFRMSKIEEGTGDYEEVKEGFSEDDLAVGGTIIYKANDQYHMSELVTKSADGKLKLMNGATCDLADVVSTNESDWPQFRDMKVDIAEAAYADDLDPTKRIVIKGVRGMKSKPFSKKFKDMAAYEVWCDSEEAEDCDVQQVMNESTDQGTEIAEAAYADDLDPDAPILVQGVRGMASKPFKKKFKNMASFEEWLDTAGDDCTPHEVTNA